MTELLHTQRWLHAQQDFLKHLGTQDYTDILGGLYLGGHIDPVIAGEIEAGIPFGAAGLRFFLESKKVAPFAILPDSRALSSPQWWDMEKNTQLVPTLCAVSDIVAQSATGSSKTSSRKPVESLAPLQNESDAVLTPPYNDTWLAHIAAQETTAKDTSRLAH